MGHLTYTKMHGGVPFCALLLDQPFGDILAGRADKNVS
jgi:hypothetical protein